MTIKAIETRYKGYRFRSRLEARWAVFFDALGVGWEYEREGYELPSGRYLPDFWFPYLAGLDASWGCWVEVKPTEPSDRECRLMAELVETTGHRGYIFTGQPWPGEHSIQVYQHHHGGRPEFVPLLTSGRLVEVNHHDGTDFQAVGFHSIVVSAFAMPSDKRFPSPFDADPFQPMMDKAFLAARSARWGHGQDPRPPAAPQVWPRPLAEPRPGDETGSPDPQHGTCRRCGEPPADGEWLEDGLCSWCAKMLHGESPS